MGALALLELLDRDGSVRQAIPVHAWPLTLGRALDNDVVLSDPHVAAQHLRVEAVERGLDLVAGATANGVQANTARLRAGERMTLPLQGEPAEITAGRTRLRLRLPEHTLAPELPFAPTLPLLRRAAPVV